MLRSNQTHTHMSNIIQIMIIDRVGKHLFLFPKVTISRSKHNTRQMAAKFKCSRITQLHEDMKDNDMNYPNEHFGSYD